MPSVEVVIPTFNDHATLARAVASALALPFVARVIVVDDGSSPPARSALDGLAGEPRLHIEEKPNGGVSTARNRGLDVSRADLVVFLDADDAFRPEIARAVELAVATGAALTIGGRVSHLPDGSTRTRVPPPEWLGEGDRGFVTTPGDVFRFRPILMFATSGMVVPRRVIDAGLRFDPEIRHGQDREFARRAADHGRIAVSSALTVDYYERADGGNLSGRKHIHRGTQDFLRIMRKHFDPRDAHHWAEAAGWRAARYAKFGSDPAIWNELVQEMKARSLPIPPKARLRWWWRGVVGR